MKLVLATVLLLATTAPAIAETWKCDYSGRWSTTGSANEGTFDWKLVWTSKAGGWRMVGDYTDKYGMSYLGGTCQNKTCKFTQTYKSGSLNGNQYSWTGTYTDKWDGKTRTINTFTGNWRALKGGTAGRWSATAICNKQ